MTRVASLAAGLGLVGATLAATGSVPVSAAPGAAAQITDAGCGGGAPHCFTPQRVPLAAGTTVAPPPVHRATATPSSPPSKAAAVAAVASTPPPAPAPTALPAAETTPAPVAQAPAAATATGGPTTATGAAPAEPPAALTASGGSPLPVVGALLALVAGLAGGGLWLRRSHR
jgi:hypothetical protein